MSDRTPVTGALNFDEAADTIVDDVCLAPSARLMEGDSTSLGVLALSVTAKEKAR